MVFMASKRRSQSGKTDVQHSVACFSAEDFELLKSIAADSDKLHDTYEEWQADVERISQIFSDAGLIVQKVQVKMIDLVPWCASRGIPLDAAARSRYAAELAVAADRD
jgi:hypothetical protein